VPGGGSPVGFVEGRRTTTRKSQHLISLAAAAAIFIVLQVLITHFYLHVPVTLAGERMRVARDISVAGLLREKKVKLVPGDLLNVRKRVIEKSKGKPPYVVVNGEQVPFSTVIHSGDVVVPHDGEDVTEPIITRKVSLPPETKIVGSGRYLAINAVGVPGVRRDYMGGLSKIVTKREVLKRPIPTVLVRTDTAPPKMVALTFDDGPWPEQTEKIADLLAAKAVPATFFILGQQAKKYPSLLRRLVDDGHVIANHTYSHPNLTRLSTADVREQLLTTQKIVVRAAQRKTYWVRPPGGNTNEKVNAIVKGLKMQPILWDLDSHDWTKPGTKSIVKTVVGGATPGCVVLMHDGGGDRTQTIQALPYIIKTLRGKGYSFVTLDGLYNVRPSKTRLPVKKASVAQNG